MKPDKELIRVATFMEPKPKFAITKTVSEKGWWRSNCKINGVVIINDANLFPNKDPRKSMDVAMEVLVHCTKKLRELFPKRSFEWGLREVEIDEVPPNDVRILYHCEISSGLAGTLGLGISKYSDTLQQAIFAAAVKLITYLKKQERDA